MPHGGLLLGERATTQAYATDVPFASFPQNCEAVSLTAIQDYAVLQRKRWL
jgi:hypothetical protein